MPTAKIVHVVLQKLEADAPSTFAEEWAAFGNSMKDKIPGLLEIQCGPCLEGSQHKTQGYSLMLYSTFDGEESLRAYATDPEHMKLLTLGKGKIADKIVFDLEI